MKKKDFLNQGQSNDLAVENFNLWFDRKQILKNVSMKLHQKKITAIMGPSGCGKSTLLRTFNRMHDFSSNCRMEGSVYVGEKDIYDSGVDVFDLRMKVGMVFQKPNPFAKSIYKNVEYGLKIKGGLKKHEIFEKVEQSLRDAWIWDEVKDRLDDLAFSLSGGQQQRLCIARALATDPDVLLLDEPTSALDPQSTNKVEELITNLKKDVTIVIVTHNIAQAARVSDYTAFMYLGELIEYNKTDFMFTTPANSRTQEYLTGKFG